MRETKLVISTKNIFDYETTLNDSDCKNIRKKVGSITIEDVNHAMDVLVTKMYEDRVYTMELDINMREAEYAPARDMTIAEIEKELGYKVKIVKEE